MSFVSSGVCLDLGGSDMSKPNSETDDLSEAEIRHRMEAGIKRALSTPPKPTKELIGNSERSKERKNVSQTKTRKQDD
jgi:hypothetical protein